MATYAVYHRDSWAVWGSYDDHYADILARFGPDVHIELAPPADPGDDPTDTPIVGKVDGRLVTAYTADDDGEGVLLSADPVQIVQASSEAGALLIARGSLPQPEYRAVQF